MIPFSKLKVKSGCNLLKRTVFLVRFFMFRELTGADHLIITMTGQKAMRSVMIIKLSNLLIPTNLKTMQIIPQKQGPRCLHWFMN